MRLRRNIFPHFLGRDSREIYGLFQSQAAATHRAALLRGLNVAAMLCENICVFPPGFLLECKIAKSVLKMQSAYVREGLVILPMRETNLGDFAEKKRREYAGMRPRYEGIYSDEGFRFLAEFEAGIVPRTSRIGEEIARKWEMGPDSKSGIWMPLKAKLSAPTIEIVRNIPARLNNEGIATTFEGMKPLLPAEATVADAEIHRTMLHVYFKLYMEEFGLVVLRGVPLMHDDFSLPSRLKIYEFSWFQAALLCFGLYDYLSLAEAQCILSLRRQSGFTSFVDAYVNLCTKVESRRTLAFHMDQAKRAVSFDWVAFRKRFRRPDGIRYALSELEERELSDALGDVATSVNRGDQDPRIPPISRTRSASGKTVERSASIAVFVALDEELEVLAHHLGLSKTDNSPAAHGDIAGIPVDVLCPRNMGRVPAAIEVTSYLDGRKSKPPSLIIVAGLAGGVGEQDMEPGDIIFGTKIVDLANRKITDGGSIDAPELKTQFRREDFHLTDSAWKVLRSDNFSEGAWLDRVIKDASWPKRRRPEVTTGIIGSVDEVVSSDTWRKQLLAATPKLKAIEMESGGVCAAARKFDVPVCVIRAISDGADPSKADDAWRERGMRTIATLLDMLPLDRVISVVRKEDVL